MTKQYARLDQSDKEVESASYIVKPEDNGGAGRKRSCCLSTFIVFAVVVMFAGGIAIVVGIFFTPQVNTMIDNYMKPEGVNATSNVSAVPNINITTTLAPSTLEQVLVVVTTTETPTTLTPTLPPAINDTIKSGESYSRENVTQSSQPDDIDTTTEELDEEIADELEEESGENEEEPEEDENETTSTTPLPSTTHRPKHHGKHITGKHHPKPRPESNEDESTTVDDGPEILDEAEEQFASWMIRLERFLEKTTGIHRPELVVPLFMLLCFIGSMTLACCCCYIMGKRRDSHRRRILGKIITDLQTGDSKSVLLGHDGDD